jgi:hypothetical protein
MNCKRFWIAAFLLTSLSSCAGSSSVQVVTEYPDIPLQFQRVLQVPEVPEADHRGEISVGEALKSASELRTYACYLRSRYKELLRFSTFGKVVMNKPNTDQCPEN